jgi:hypothetical protein
MMHMSVFIQPEVAEAIVDLLDEMSAFMKMERMVKMLESAGYQPPDTYRHILERYRKTVN